LKGGKNFKGSVMVPLACTAVWTEKLVPSMTAKGEISCFKNVTSRKAWVTQAISTGHSRELEFPKQKYFTFNAPTCYSSPRLMLCEVCENCILSPKLHHHFPTT
jgi:hypothetical protein